MSEQNYEGLRDIPANTSLRNWMGRMNEWLEAHNAKAEEFFQVQEYTEIRIGMLASQGMSELAASEEVEHERKEDVEAFEGRAVDLFAYRKRLTEGDGAIPFKTFQYAVDKTPQLVLDDSRFWAELSN